MPRRNKQIKHIRLIVNDNCQSKRRYLNEREALKTAEFQMLVNPGLSLSTYKCDICQGWHLTRLTKD